MASYGDCKTVFEKAAALGFVRLSFATPGKAAVFAVRMNRYRNLLRRQNEGTSHFDYLFVRHPTEPGTKQRSCFIVVEPRNVPFDTMTGPDGEVLLSSTESDFISTFLKGK